jgi:hypothetical protein
MKSAQKINFHQKAYVCRHVFVQSAPVLFVSRPDGDWCFLCGQQHEQSASEYRVVGIGHILEQDQSLVNVMDLLPDWEAERTEIDEEWIRARVPVDE